MPNVLLILHLRLPLQLQLPILGVTILLRIPLLLWWHWRKGRLQLPLRPLRHIIVLVVLLLLALLHHFVMCMPSESRMLAAHRCNVWGGRMATHAAVCNVRCLKWRRRKRGIVIGCAAVCD